MVCGNVSEVELTNEEANAVDAGLFIQDALPERPASFRELVFTGTHPECWNSIFNGQDDDFEDYEEDEF